MGVTALNDLIDNVSDGFLKKTSLSMKKKRGISAKQAEYDADKLVRTFNAPQSRKFFLKCIYHLSPSFIWETVEASQRKGVKTPVKYFNAACRNEMDKLGVK